MGGAGRQSLAIFVLLDFLRDHLLIYDVLYCQHEVFVLLLVGVSVLHSSGEMLQGGAVREFGAVTPFHRRRLLHLHRLQPLLSFDVEFPDELAQIILANCLIGLLSQVQPNPRHGPLLRTLRLRLLSLVLPRRLVFLE